MDLHVYRNSQDRWHDLRSEARDRGAILALNALTLDELVQRLTPDIKSATVGQRLVLSGADYHRPQYSYEALAQLKAARIRSADLRDAGAGHLADILDGYDAGLRQAGLVDPQDRRAIAAARVAERARPWLQKFERVILHAIYDLTEAEFQLVHSIIDALPDGGTVMLFNSTANVKPTQFAEWTWQRFIRDESLAERTFPEFCRSSNPGRPVLERLFVFDSAEPLPPDDSLQIFEAPGRYKEAELIGSEICDLMIRGESPDEIAVVVRHIETYGEMLEDVFSRYGIPHSFETGVPLVRIPFIKYWLTLLDLATSERSRDALARVMSSAYFEPRLSPRFDVERVLATCGYIDRNHLRASAMAARKKSPLTPELERLEQWLDSLENSTDTVLGFLRKLKPSIPLTERDRQAWRVLYDELEVLGSLPLSRDGVRAAAERAGEGISFTAFRRIASEIAGIRTIERLSGAPVPPGLPCVRILGPQSLAAREYRWIFAPGLADGEFPARLSANPLLPDETVQAINDRLRQRRLMTARDRGRREPLYLFMLLDSATRRVTLTYPGSTLEGEPIYPSVYVGEIARHFKDSPVMMPSPGARSSRPPLPGGEGARLRVLADEWRKGTLKDDRARELLGPDIVRRVEWEKRGTARAHIGRGVMPIEGVWHPSELNSLSACPFVFLARYRLKLRATEIPDYEVPPMEVGIFAHSILRDFYMQPVPDSVDEARRRMDEIVARRLSTADVNGQGAYSVFDPALWKIRRRQLVAVLDAYIDFAVRDAADGFVTQPEYLDSALPPARLGPIVLGGKPDHIAVHRTGGRIDGIRIDDFKYSAASSATNKLLKQSFQIPVYAYLTVQALGAETGIRMDGRYLLLRSPSNPVVAHPIDEIVFDEVAARIDGLLEKVREGRLHPEPADRQDCTGCDYRRLCRLYGS